MTHLTRLSLNINFEVGAYSYVAMKMGVWLKTWGYAPWPQPKTAIYETSLSMGDCKKLKESGSRLGMLNSNFFQNRNSFPKNRVKMETQILSVQ